jgi:proline iminopeptidase
LSSARPAPREGYIPLEGARLFYRDIGAGHPIVILHGGPDFGHTYLLPDMDRLSDSFRLIYYDQRGRGRSADGVRPEDVSMSSEVEDLEGLRRHLGLDSMAVLGHSWGGMLAMEYAIRYPERVSRLILMGTIVASHDDHKLFRQELRRRRTPAQLERMTALADSAEYAAGDPDTVAERYRIHYTATFRRPEDHLDRLIDALRSSFTPEGIVKGRAIEDRLMDETLLSPEYNLIPELERLSISTLVIHGDDDVVPVECAARIAHAIPGARFVVLKDCGHFSYMERPDEVRKEMNGFFAGTER